MRKTFNDTDYGLPSSDDVAFLDLEADGLRPTRIHCVAIKYRGITDRYIRP